MSIPLIVSCATLNARCPINKLARLNLAMTSHAPGSLQNTTGGLNSRLNEATLDPLTSKTILNGNTGSKWTLEECRGVDASHLPCAYLRYFLILEVTHAQCSPEMKMLGKQCHATQCHTSKYVYSNRSQAFMSHRGVLHNSALVYRLTTAALAAIRDARQDSV